MRTAVITGALGQDGRLLTALLLAQGHRVVGVVKPDRLAAIPPALPPGPAAPDRLHYLSVALTDAHAVGALLDEWQPDEFYHLSAAHHASEQAGNGGSAAARRVMVEQNFRTTETIAFALLESALPCHLVYAASSQMYTAAAGAPLVVDEDTPMRPSTFYGRTKAWSRELLGALRAELGLRASTAILFNHESALRGPQFVTRKVTRAAAMARPGGPVELSLQNIGAQVDWSAAEDAVRALHLMAGAPAGADYVVASGQLRTVRELLAHAFGSRHLDWRSHARYAEDEPGPALVGQPARLQAALGWRPRVAFETLVEAMVAADRVTPPRP